MVHRQSVPKHDPDTKNQPLLIAGIISGLACLVLVPALYKLALSVSDRLFGPAQMHTTYEAGRTVAREIAPHRWIGGLVVAFVAGLALLVSAQVRSRHRLSVKQYWAATVLLVLLSLAALFWMGTLS